MKMESNEETAVNLKKPQEIYSIISIFYVDSSVISWIPPEGKEV